MMYWLDSDAGGWAYILMAVTMVGFWALVVTGVILLVRGIGRSEERAELKTAPATPEELLAQRFARGDIDEVEYDDRLSALRRRHVPL